MRGLDDGHPATVARSRVSGRAWRAFLMQLMVARFNQSDDFAFPDGYQFLECIKGRHRGARKQFFQFNFCFIDVCKAIDWRFCRFIMV